MSPNLSFFNVKRKCEKEKNRIFEAAAAANTKLLSSSSSNFKIIARKDKFLNRYVIDMRQKWQLRREKKRLKL